MTFSVAITGANGYVGGLLADALRKEGHHIYSMGRRARPQDEGVFVPFHLGQKNDYAVLDKTDVLIHCAYDFSARSWQEICRINIDASNELLREAHRRGVKKIIFLSSICAYENAKSYYGKAKLAIEKQATLVGAVNLRPGTVFGKNAAGIIGTISAFIRKNRIVPLIGMGGQIFYPCHEDDLTGVVSKLLALPALPATPVTAACKETITYKKLVQFLAKAEHRKVVLLPIPYVFIYALFAILQKLDIHTVRGTDSLINLNNPNLHPDFREAQKLGVIFHPLTLASLRN